MGNQIKMDYLVSHPIGCDYNMGKVMDAALEGETKVDPVLAAFSNLTKALEDYLKERRIIQNGYSMKDFGIVDPYPKQPIPARSKAFRTCLIDPLTIPVDDQESVPTEDSPVAEYISPFDMKMAQYLMYLQRLNSFAQDISSHYKICLDLDNMWHNQQIKSAAQFDKDYRIVCQAYYDLDYHFKHTDLAGLMEAMLAEVRSEAEGVKEDRASTTANLIRGLAMCMIVSNKCIKDHYEDLADCLSPWRLYGSILIREWNARTHNEFKLPPTGGRIISYAEDQEALGNYKPEVSPAVGMDLME